MEGKKYLAIFQSKQTTGSPIGNNCRILDITNGFASATIVATTERLGDTSNINAAGDVDVRYTTYPVSLTAITLATNNGVSAKRIFGVVIENGDSNNTLNIEQNSFGKHGSVTIYPNPVGNAFTISISKNMDAKCKISIYSIDGKLVKTEAMQNPIQNINVDALSNGIYLIKIQNGEKNYQTKFIKS
uniref:T9SS type A sorting domain-containing protein n=1 Tax=Mariniflexile sp. TaxID=1979402 RepID=UPI00404777DB